MILIFNVNTNHENVIYRFFSFSKFETRNVRKIITEIDISIVSFFSRDEFSTLHLISKMSISTIRKRLIVDRRSNVRKNANFSKFWYELFSIVQNLEIYELTCDNQTFITTLLFDFSMSILFIISKQNSINVELFTH